MTDTAFCNCHHCGILCRYDINDVTIPKTHKGHWLCPTCGEHRRRKMEWKRLQRPEPPAIAALGTTEVTEGTPVSIGGTPIGVAAAPTTDSALLVNLGNTL